MFPLKLNKLVNLVCADDRIAVAATNTKRVQAIFESLSLRLRAEVEGEVAATKVAVSVLEVEFFIVFSVNLMS